MSDSQEKVAAPGMTVTVDGVTFTAQPGELVIAAAERNGVYIPRFCWHPRMKPVGMCRMCLVEVDGVRGLPPACTLPVADGMVVHTKSPTVIKAQEGVLEFLLINHPLDCPVCDRGGECPLQDTTMAFGPGESRFVEEKRHYEKPIPISDLVMLDRERCILCARCTRFADEIAGDPLISFTERGGGTQVLTFPDEPFSSYFSGNTVELCPVGALLAKPYRFRARPWDLEESDSTCTTCAVGCRTTVQSSGDRVARVLGLDSDAVNHGWLCDKGRFTHEALEADDRVLSPLRRIPGTSRQFESMSWAEALSEVADRIRDALTSRGPGSVAVLGGARGTNEDAYAWAKFAKGVVGTDNVDAQLGDGVDPAVVLTLPGATIDEACAGDVVLMMGPDVKEELPVLFLRLKAAAERGCQIIEVSPVRTGLSKYCSQSVIYRPGELAAVSAVLAGTSAVEITAGVSADDLGRAREAVAGAQSLTVLYGRASLAESAAGVEHAVLALADALPNARFLSLLRRGNVRGAVAMGLTPGLLPGAVEVGPGSASGWFRSAGWSVLPTTRGHGASEILAAAADGSLSVLILLGADPLGDFPDRRLAEQALARVPYVVSLDLFRTESADLAHVILPAAGPGERSGTTTNIEGRVTRVRQKVSAPGMARPDWTVAADLAEVLGESLGFEALDDVTAEIARVVPGFGVLTEIDDPANTVVGVVTDRQVSSGSATAGSVGEADKADTVGEADKADTVGEADKADTVGEADRINAAPATPVRIGRPPSRVLDSTPSRDAYSVRLVAARSLYDHGTMTQRSPSLAHLAAGPSAELSPSQASKLGVRDGDSVRVTSSSGQVVVGVRVRSSVSEAAVEIRFRQGEGSASDLIAVDQRACDVRVETRQ